MDLVHLKVIGMYLSLTCALALASTLILGALLLAADKRRAILRAGPVNSDDESEMRTFALKSQSSWIL